MYKSWQSCSIKFFCVCTQKPGNIRDNTRQFFFSGESGENCLKGLNKPTGRENTRVFFVQDAGIDENDPGLGFREKMATATHKVNLKEWLCMEYR